MKKKLIVLGLVILAIPLIAYGAKSAVSDANLQFLEWRYNYANQEAHRAFCGLVEVKLGREMVISQESLDKYDTECLGL